MFLKNFAVHCFVNAFIKPVCTVYTVICVNVYPLHTTYRYKAMQMTS